MKIPEQLPSNPMQVRVLHRPKVGGGILSVAHAAIEFLYANSERYVLHRTPDNNTHISSYKDFAAGQEVTAKVFDPQNIDALMQRANFTLTQGKSYSALFDNCEHLKSFVLFGETESEQLKSALIGGGGGALLAATLLKDKHWWVKLLAVTGGAAAALHLEKKSKLKKAEKTQA
ncbi:hypothetical protein A3759_00540 [Thalassolituus sp. HI0120]|nr:hypothetical protein A3759_00540 [Thalassolituus sp. HI0120]